MMKQLFRLLLLPILLACCSSPALARECTDYFYTQRCGAWAAPPASEVKPIGTEWVCEKQVDLQPHNPGICIDYYGLVCPIGKEWTGNMESEFMYGGRPSGTPECKSECERKAGEQVAFYRSVDEPPYPSLICVEGCLTEAKYGHGHMGVDPATGEQITIGFFTIYTYLGADCESSPDDPEPGGPNDGPGDDGPGDDGPGDDGPGDDGPGDDGPGDDGPGDDGPGDDGPGDDGPGDDDDGPGDDDDDDGDSESGKNPGDGPGDGDGDGEGDERTAGGSCDQGFNCTGDAIDCAVARHTWSLKCAQEARKATDSEDCDGDFTCEGDPIDCAVLKRQRESYCALQPDEEVIADGNRILSGDDEMLTAEGSPENPESVELQSIQPKATAGGQCPKDVYFLKFRIPLSEFCWILQAMGYGLVICAWILAAKIIASVATV